MHILGKLSGVPAQDYRFFKNATNNQIIGVNKENGSVIVVEPEQIIALSEIEAHMIADRKPFQEQRIVEVTNEIPGYKKGEANFKEHLPVSSKRTGASWKEIEKWLKEDEATIIDKATKLKSLIMFDKLMELCKDARKSWVLVRDLTELRKTIEKKIKDEEEQK
jgi:hypothetical protein